MDDGTGNVRAAVAPTVPRREFEMSFNRSRRTTKAAFSLIAVVASLAFAGSASAETNGTLTYSVADGEVTITGCDGGAAACPTSLAIPATIDDKPVTSIADSAFLDAVNLETVTIADSVTSIGKLVFGRDYALTSVTLPSGLTTISENLFRGATALSSVNIPEGVTTIETAAFFNTQLLRSVTLPSTLKTLGGAAFQGSGLTTLTIPSGVESLGICAFMWNTSLATVTIPKSVVSIGAEAFRGNFSLKEVTFQGDAPSMGSNVFEFDPVEAQATVAHSALKGFGTEGADFHGLVVHYALEVVYSIADDKVSITSCIGGAGGCPEVMVLPSTIEGLPVTKIGFGAFYTAWGIKSITLPSTLTEIGGYAFGFNWGLTSVSIPASVTKINESAFANDKNLANVNFAGNAPELGTNAFSGLRSGAKASLATTSLTGFGFNGDLFGGLAVSGGPDRPPYTYFVGSESVIITGCLGGVAACPATLVIPASIEGKPVTVVDSEAFYGSPTLTDVTLPDTVTSIGNGAFFFVPLKRITLGEGLKEIGYAAFAYTSLTSITFPASLTSIASQAFAPADQLSDVIFQGNAPTVGSGALVNVAQGATATLASPSLTGFGLNGDTLEGLVIRGGVFKAPTLAGVPTEPTKSTSATFTINGDDAATFKCSLDGGPYLACASPFRVRRLAPGDHTLSVTQAGAAGSESVPVVANWTVTELDAPRLLSKVGLRFNFKTRVTTLSLNAAADEGSANSIKWIEYSNHPKRPAANAVQAPSRIRAYAPTVSLTPGQVAFWVRFKDTNLQWSGWYRTRFKPGAIGW